MTNDATPGCFGSALTFEAEAAECRSCPFAPRCGPLSAERLQALRAKYGITIKTKRGRPKIEPKPAAVAMTPVIPPDIQALADRIEGAGLRVTEKLGKGENPFPERFGFLRVFAHLLLRAPGGFDRPLLKRALAQKLGCSAETAEAYTRKAVLLMTALGAIRETNGMFQIKR